MQRFLTTAAIAALSAGSAFAAGLDRSGQSTVPLFDGDPGERNLALSYGYVDPSLTGTDALGNSYDVGGSYSQVTLSYRADLNDKWSYAVIADQPYGADIFYNNSPLTSTLGGTGAQLDSAAMTALGRYKVTDRISVFGGLRFQSVEAAVTLNGQAYASAIAVSAVARGFNAALPAGAAALDSTVLGAALQGNTDAVTAIETTYGAGTTALLGGQVTTTATNFLQTGGYAFQMDQEVQPGLLIGAAYEIPDIALRLAVTYHGEIEYSAGTSESLLGNTTAGSVDYVTPQAINVDFQTGIAANTLLTSSFRWSDYSAVDLVPDVLQSDLVNLDDGKRFTIGVARRFNDNWAGSIEFLYEPTGDDNLVSPLGPTDGLRGVTLRTQYRKNNLKLAAGINYSVPGDAGAEVGGTSQVDFSDMSSLGVGFKAEFVF